MKLLTGVDAAVSDWLAAKHRAYIHQEPRALLAVVDALDCIRGAYVITWHHDRTAELHVYGTATPDTAKALFFFIFVGCRIWRLTVRVPRHNKRMKRIVPRFGFTFQCVEKDFYGPGEDALAFYMLPHQCRWIDGLGFQIPAETR